MCFSATASFVAGTAISAVGVVTLMEPKDKKAIPFATIPLLFGLQQIVEGGVWLSLGTGAQFLNTISTYAYLFFGYLLWPVFLPFSIGLLETDPHRRKIIYTLQALGVAVSTYLLFFIVQNPVEAHVVNESIRYTMPTQYGTIPAILYLLATCGSCLFSSHRMIVVLGILGVLALAVAYYFYTVSFVSVWCFFAAVLSIFIYTYFRNNK